MRPHPPAVKTESQQTVSPAAFGMPQELLGRGLPYPIERSDSRGLLVWPQMMRESTLCSSEAVDRSEVGPRAGLLAQIRPCQGRPLKLGSAKAGPPEGSIDAARVAELGGPEVGLHEVRTAGSSPASLRRSVEPTTGRSSLPSAHVHASELAGASSACCLNREVCPRTAIYHCTSPDGLLGILQHHELRATQASGMNDVAEVRQGWEFINQWLEAQDASDHVVGVMRELAKKNGPNT